MSQKTSPEPAKHFYKYQQFIALVYITLLLCATVSAYKIVQIRWFPEPGSTLIYTFSFFWISIFTEVYGFPAAKKLIWETIACGYIFAFLITGINLLPSPDYWDNHQTYNQVLGHTLRFTTAGTVGYLISVFINILLLDRWKRRLKGKLFGLRSFFAAALAEAVATFTAGIMTFFGMMPLEKILFIMTNALAFKLLYGFVAAWPASLVAFLLKKQEGMLEGSPTLSELESILNPEKLKT